MNNSDRIDEKLLIVTASEPLQKELSEMLVNYTLVFVHDGIAAKELLTEDNNFAAVLIGIYLPETKGFEFLNYLKENEHFYTGPVLVVVDSITDSVISDTSNYDIFDFVVRYSSEQIIKARIRNAVIYYSEKRKLLTYAIEQMYENMNDMKMLISLLARILEFKNEESGKHVENVSTITRILAKKLVEKYPDKYTITDRTIEYITMAAALHDIGKVYIPSEILNKPGKLDPQQRIIMEAHAALGASIIDTLVYYKDRPVFRYIKQVCLGHHERWDGKGYPNHVKGSDIPISAQIVSVADCYDALTSDRVYRAAMSHEEALNNLMDGACGVFNPDLLECLQECAEEIRAKKDTLDTIEVSKESLSNIIKEICKIK